MVEITMGQSPSSKNYTENPSDYILVQGNADMKNGHVVPRVWTTQITKQAEKGDLILSVRAPVGDIGKTDYDVVIGRGVAAIKGNSFIFQLLTKMKITGYWTRFSTGSTFESINSDNLKNAQIIIPSLKEQEKIGKTFNSINSLISLHQRKLILGGKMEKVQYFHDYYKNWIRIYKEGAVRPITLAKYKMTLQWLCRLAPKLELSQLDRIAYQGLLNAYALEHERQTTMDFHHQLKGAILDALDDGIIDKDPTRKAIIKGKIPATKRIKYLSQFELRSLLAELDLGKEISWDWFILLVAKTGLRFSEALALTPQDFDFSHQVITVDKTWDYKDSGGFLPTKNKSSARKVQIDWQLVIQFFELTKDLPERKPIFVSGKVYNSTVNNCLFRRCRAAKIPEISIHSLRHTHASLLLFSGVSIASVARRLGHASMTTTQKTYLHIIRELENQDIDLIMRSLTSLT